MDHTPWFCQIVCKPTCSLLVAPLDGSVASAIVITKASFSFCHSVLTQNISTKKQTKKKKQTALYLLHYKEHSHTGLQPTGEFLWLWLQLNQPDRDLWNNFHKRKHFCNLGQNIRKWCMLLRTLTTGVAPLLGNHTLCSSSHTVHVQHQYVMSFSLESEESIMFFFPCRPMFMCWLCHIRKY